MKNLTQVLFALPCLCMPALLHTQRDDSKCLAGAVPEADGKVVFTKDFSIPGMSQDTIYSHLLKWTDTRLAKNENTSRVVYSDREKGQIVGMGDEWIVFSSIVPSLDRTKILYQLTLICRPEKCTLKVEKIRFSYREGKEKYTAEEWITDKYALNKSKAKLVRNLVKWRRKTMDFVDDLCVDITEALGASTVAKAPAVERKEEKKTETVLANSGITIITPKTQVTVETPKTSAAPVVAIESASAAYKEVSPDAIPSDTIQTGNGGLVIVIGEEPSNTTMMTANASGSLGKIAGNKAVVFTILSPDQPYGQMDVTQNYIVRFYPNGQNEPSIILECKKFPSQTLIEGMPRTYIGEILKAKIK